MLDWILENAANIVICAVLFSAAAAAVIRLIRGRKNKNGSCCGCESCGMNGKCGKK